MPALKFETTAAAANNNRRPFSFVCFFCFDFDSNGQIQSLPTPFCCHRQPMTIIDQRNEGAVLALGSFFVFFLGRGWRWRKKKSNRRPRPSSNNPLRDREKKMKQPIHSFALWRILIFVFHSPTNRFRGRFLRTRSRLFNEITTQNDG